MTGGVISNKARMKELWGESECQICGEPFRSIHDEVGEFCEPGGDTDGNPRSVFEHKIAHAQCGLDAGMELA